VGAAAVAETAPPPQPTSLATSPYRKYGLPHSTTVQSMSEDRFSLKFIYHTPHFCC
jgi:hypothetical protein